MIYIDPVLQICWALHTIAQGDEYIRWITFESSIVWVLQVFRSVAGRMTTNHDLQ